MATCTVCLEAPTEPRALSCRHIFCTNCLRKMFDEVLFRAPLVCPNCRAETDVPLEGVDGLPLYSDTQKSEEIPSFNAKAEIEARCKNCEDPDTANVEPAAYCSDCEGGICESCWGSHKRMKIFRNHNFVPWNEFCPDTFKPKRSHKHCGTHPEMEVQLFCEPCNQFICCLCLKGRHKVHIDSAKCLKEVSKDKAEKVSQLQETAENMFVRCEQRLEGLKEKEDWLAGYPGNLKKSIIDTFEEYMGQLELWREQQLMEAQERCSGIAKGITAKQTDTTNTMERLRVGIQLAKEAVSCTTDHEIIEMSGKAINQLKCTTEACDESPIQRPLVFEKGNLHFGRLRDIEPGDIKVEFLDYCFMHEENRINVSFTLPVNTLPSLKILYGSQKQRSVRVPPPALADTKLGFVPRCAGKHYIEVYIGGVMCKSDDVMVVRGAPNPGGKVKPGPDWKDEENIGVTSGTVLNVEPLTAPFARIAQLDDEQLSFKVTVQWDNGNEVDYNWGDSDEYQLELDD